MYIITGRWACSTSSLSRIFHSHGPCCPCSCSARWRPWCALPRCAPPGHTFYSMFLLGRLVLSNPAPPDPPPSNSKPTPAPPQQACQPPGTDAVTIDSHTRHSRNQCLGKLYRDDHRPAQHHTDRAGQEGPENDTLGGINGMPLPCLPFQKLGHAIKGLIVCIDSKHPHVYISSWFIFTIFAECRLKI